ncbi:hypothetical protein AB0D29_14160 [Streptomyces sp. NPDC048424]|uniref:hypothetical protein n=1 Tax=Streptomyces sp. NPDC048424 TaxID=3155265 RepID=UPI0034163190
MSPADTADTVVVGHPLPRPRTVSGNLQQVGLRTVAAQVERPGRSGGRQRVPARPYGQVDGGLAVAMRRLATPMRSQIHSSPRERRPHSSALVRTRGGTYAPRPARTDVRM